MAKIVCVLYEDPVDGYPTTYPREEIPTVEHYPGGQTVPSPASHRFHAGSAPGQRVGRAGPAPVP